MSWCCNIVCLPQLCADKQANKLPSVITFDQISGHIYEALPIEDQPQELLAKTEEMTTPTTIAVFPGVNSRMESAATQTDPVSDDEFEASESTCPMLTRLGMSAEGYIDDTDLEEQCRQELDTVEFEEITLHRCSSVDRIGLTLCYGGNLLEDNETDIFISEIEAGSIADRDGRIREGDQILQMNGVDVHTRDQAIRLFKKNKKEISLLVARTAVASTEDDEQRTDSKTDETESGGAGDHHRLTMGLSPMAEEEHEYDEGDEPRGDSADGSAKDSGISRATDSDPELLPPPQIEEDESNTTTPTTVPSSSTLVGGGRASTAAESDDGSLERELRSLHREMETIRLECDRLIAKHATAERKVLQQVAKAQNLIVTMDSMTGADPPPIPQHRQVQPQYAVPPIQLQQPQQQLEPVQTVLMRRPDDTSSAYNTGGESCRSTPMKMAAHTTLDLRRPPSCAHVTPPLAYPSANGGGPYSASSTLIPADRRRHNAASNTAIVIPQQQPFLADPVVVGQSATLSLPLFQPGDIMYTNPENLQRTIQLQQRLLRQAMIQQAQQLKNQQSMVPNGGPVQSSSMHQALGDEVEKCQWKIKRRSDGSRYVTRRPVRNRLLEKRAAELSNERVGTTDDDASSELKVGRWWSKDERKKHLEAARQRKVRQQELLRRKNAVLAAHADAPIVRLSQNKMRRRHALFDNFTTLQEHLARRHSQPMPQLGLLSVTTV